MVVVVVVLRGVRVQKVRDIRVTDDVAAVTPIDCLSQRCTTYFFYGL